MLDEAARRRRRTRAVALMVLGAILVLHFLSRRHAYLSRPIGEMHFYSSSYLVSLSLLAGKGFNYTLPRGVDPGPSLEQTMARLRQEPGPAGPVMSFLSGDSRRLSRQDWTSFLGADPTPIAPDVLLAWDSVGGLARILDARLAAALWALFGIDWDVLFAFYAALSTAACAALFGITARVSGSVWGGVLGAVSFALSPLERDLGAWSFRDANPLWFSCIAIWVLLCWASPVSRWSVSCLRWFGIGAASMIGLGWRPDVYVLLPYAAVGLTLLLTAQHVRLRLIIVALAWFVIGVAGVRSAIGWLGPVSARPVVGGGAIFHVAWYADDARSNLLQTENVFQARAADHLVLYQANYHSLYSRTSLQPSPKIFDPRHYATTRAMYLEMVRYHLFAWWSRFPGLLAVLSTIDGATSRPPPIGIEVSPDARSSAGRAIRAGLAFYLKCIPWLCLLAVASGVLSRSRRVATVLVAGYFVLYAAVELAILPEVKHWGPLLLPLHALSGAGLCQLLRAATTHRGLGSLDLSPRLRIPARIACVGLLCWGLLGLVAHAVSQAQRRRIVDDILAAARSPLQPERSPEKPRLHTIDVPSGEPTRPIGYLFRVRGARRDVDLFCLHAREGHGQTPLYYATHHRIEAQREQYFFLSPIAGVGVGEMRNYKAYVSVRGGATLVSVTAVDMSESGVALPLSLVFTGRNDPLDRRTLSVSTEAFESLEQADALVNVR
jgi:hypothetical protein